MTRGSYCSTAQLLLICLELEVAVFCAAESCNNSAIQSFEFLLPTYCTRYAASIHLCPFWQIQQTPHVSFFHSISSRIETISALADIIRNCNAKCQSSLTQNGASNVPNIPQCFLDHSRALQTVLDLPNSINIQPVSVKYFLGIPSFLVTVPKQLFYL